MNAEDFGSRDQNGKIAKEGDKTTNDVPEKFRTEKVQYKLRKAHQYRRLSLDGSEIVVGIVTDIIAWPPGPDHQEFNIFF